MVKESVDNKFTGDFINKVIFDEIIETLKMDLDELKHFAVKLRIEGRVVAKARATSKKKAEEKASKRAYYAFQAKITPS